MGKPTTIHSTFQLERSFAASTEKVFAAFADPSSKRRWNYESGKHELQFHELDFRVGGGERAQLVFGNNGSPVAGMTCKLDAVFEEIVPGRRIVWAYRMNIAGRTISAALATVEILPAETGCEVLFTHQGAYFEGADGPEMRKGGWENLLGKLATELGE
jgi:uncharacterized protein YndB with AHSA1/START domain